MAYGGPTRISRGRPSSNFELFSWFFMRVSGVLLAVLVLGHVAVMHIINSVDELSYAWVAERWATPFWRTYDALLLILALLHGMNGLRWAIDDYAHSRGWRLFWLSLLVTVGLILMVLGLLVLFTFQPV